MAALTLLGEFVVAVLLVDLASGVVHWFEDQYGSRSMPAWMVKYIVIPNRLHHIYPRAVVHCPRWISVLQGVGPGLLFMPILIAVLGWRISGVAICLAALPNFVHKWNHQRDSERPTIVKLLQRARILQGPRHHHAHHVGDTDVAYCVVTPYLNPLLDAIGFWRGLEKAIYLITRVQANSPQEPHKYFRVVSGKVMEYQFDRETWTEWPHLERYQRPVR